MEKVGICGRCANYVKRPYNEDICAKTGKVVPYMAINECFVEKTQSQELKIVKKDNQMEEDKTIQTKVCKECGRELPIDQFSTQYKSKDGHLSSCKDCTRAKNSESLKAHWDKKRRLEQEQSEPATSEVGPVTVAEAPKMPTDAELVAILRSHGWEVKCSRVTVEEL